MPTPTSDSDLEAVKAMDRLARAMPKNLDIETIRQFVARHVGRNPHIATPLDPEATTLQECEQLRARVAKLNEQCADLRTQLQDAKAAAKAAQQAARNHKASADKRVKAARMRAKAPLAPGAFDKTAWQRDYMRKRRANKTAEPAAK